MSEGVEVSTALGTLFHGDALEWLASLPGESADLVVADPPYNIGMADWDGLGSMGEYVRWSRSWVGECRRILRPRGTMYVFGRPEIVAHVLAAVAPLFGGARWLVWAYRNKANLGRDWGRSHEAIIHLRAGRKFTMNVDSVRVAYGGHTLAYPDRTQAESSRFSRPGVRRDGWRPHPAGAKPRDVIEIPTTCNGMGEKTPHPTQKPEALIRRLVLASSNPGDVVVDPFSGSGTVAVVCEQLGRRWRACEAEVEYNRMAMSRIAGVAIRDADAWAAFDRESEGRRRGLRGRGT